jgi:hypothetical protein
VKLPTAALVQEVQSKYDPEPEAGRWVKKGERFDWERNTNTSDDLAVVLCKAFKV